MSATGCDFVNTRTKMGTGQLYQSGDGRYDPYFAQVHQDQLSAANWPEESKNARKPIITALSIRPGAGNTTILSATREKKGDASVGKAVDETVSAERELARKLNAAANSLEELKKRGEDLRKQAIEDKRNLGADKADEAKVAKKDEVKNELSAAVDAVDSMLSDARKGAREADELARKLRGAFKGTDDEEKDDDKKDDRRDEKKDDKKDDKKKPEPVAKKPTPKVDKPAPPPAEDKPKPQPKQPDEVFNP